ncbi:MAG: hypothetical protein Q7R41_16740 [Phycisphaerales bacterium]|nr:hypothetical protein [Phycisphaerales bacterium]
MLRVVRLVRVAVMSLKTTMGRTIADDFRASPAREHGFCEFEAVHFQRRSE